MAGFATQALWARAGRGSRLDNLRHALHVSACHPQRGVALLRQLGVEAELLRIIGAHHEPPSKKDPPALVLLRQALTEKAAAILGPTVTDVLITEIARQDS